MAKPIVSFGEVIAIGPGEGNSHLISARLSDIEGHPRLGSLPVVYTSGVIRVEEENGEVHEIETQNTIYKKRLTRIQMVANLTPETDV